MQLIHFRSGVNGFYIPVIFSDALYDMAVNHIASTLYLYEQDRSFPVTTAGKASAEEWAEEFAERAKDTLRSYGVMDSCIAYWANLDPEKNKYSLFTFPDEQTQSGSYSIYPSGTQYSSANYRPLTVGDSVAYCIRGEGEPYIYGVYGPWYLTEHSNPGAGFWGYGTDSWSVGVLPESIYKDGDIDTSDIPDTVYLTWIGCSVGCYEVMSGIHATANVGLHATTAYNLKSFLTSYMNGVDVIETDNPFVKAGTMDNTPVPGSMLTGVGGGGAFTRTNDPIPFPSLPAISAVDTGMLTLYVGSASDMHNLANYLWSGLFDPDTFKKLFASPMEAIIGASIIPVTPPSMPATILFGNVDTQVAMSRATSQYVIVDCGSLPLAEYWGAYLDYSPFTKIHIYLPYIGYKEINVDEVMGKTLSVKYMVDCLSGAIYAAVMADSKVLYQYSGSCAVQVPLTANNWGQAIGSIIQVAGQAIGGYMAGGPAGAILSGGTSLVSNAVSGNLKPEIQRNGSVTGSGGVMAVQKPYIVLEAPRQSMPANYNKFEGFPANVTLVLATCKGFTQIEEINLDGVPATEAELAEIESLLKSGVIF